MSSSGKLFALLAALLLAAATAIGAWTSHGLESVLGAHALAIVATAVQYQYYHGLGLLAVALLTDRIPRIPSGPIRVAGWLMFAGAILFCGSIYLVYLLGAAAAAPLTPVGGSTMIASWLALAYALARVPADTVPTAGGRDRPPRSGQDQAPRSGPA